jgi:hypothetical protein
MSTSFAVGRDVFDAPRVTVLGPEDPLGDANGALDEIMALVACAMGRIDADGVADRIRSVEDAGRVMQYAYRQLADLRRAIDEAALRFATARLDARDGGEERQ